jgi:hypothetical protein
MLDYFLLVKSQLLRALHEDKILNKKIKFAHYRSRDCATAQPLI